MIYLVKKSQVLKRFVSVQLLKQTGTFTSNVKVFNTSFLASFMVCIGYALFQNICFNFKVVEENDFWMK